MNQESVGECSVEVVIRLQPPENQDIHLLSCQTLACLNKQYSFDHIFAPTATQEQVYQQVGLKMVASARRGYNCCIFAYGQTGSGKTYTMTGAEHQEGLVQRTMRELFSMLEGFESFELKLSYCEIYNEQVNDLLALNPKKNKDKPIKIKESLTLGFYLEGLQEVKVEGVADLFEHLDKGLRNRTTAETRMNRESSRSHSILTLLINTRQQRETGEGFSIKSSKMHFVDLAGSEKQKSTLTAGDRLKEASSINKSLTSLSIVIEKLSGKATHIPYRDSVLTKVLRDSLGGNSKTILLATLSSKEESMPETISTLNFATKAKKVKLAARVNEQYDGSLLDMQRRIKELEEEIKALKAKESDGHCPSCDTIKSEYEAMASKMSQLENELREKEQAVQKYAQMLESMQRQHQQEVAQWMQMVEETQNIPFTSQLNQSNLTSILKRLEEGQQADSLASYEQQGQEQRDEYSDAQPAYNQSLPVIQEQSAEHEGSQSNNMSLDKVSEISFRTFRKNTEGRRRGSKCSKNQSNDLSSFFETSQLQSMRGLKEKNILLESELRICRLELQHQIKESERKVEENKRYYEPIIKQWVESNGEIIKQNLRARNAVEQDLLVGLRAKNNSLKLAMQDNEDKWMRKEQEYRNTIEKLMKVAEQVECLSKSRRGLAEIQEEWESEPSKQYLSKSHPRDQERPRPILEMEFKAMNVQTSPILNGLLNNSVSQAQTESMQKLQEELDRQDLIREQLTRELEDYKLKAERLEGEISENRQLATFWQSKCGGLTQAKKDLEKALDEMAAEKDRLLFEISRKIKEEQEGRLERAKVADELRRQVRVGEQKIAHLEVRLSAAANSGQNTAAQLENYQKCIESWEKKYDKLAKQKAEEVSQLQKKEAELGRVRENSVYLSEKLAQDIKMKTKEVNDLQRESSKQYLEMAEYRDQCKLLAMKYNELKDAYERAKTEREQLILKNKDLCAFIEQDQSQACKDIQKLNEVNAQLLQKLEKTEVKYSFMRDNFNSRVNEAKYWKEEYEKQRKWAQDYKQMHDELMASYERERSRDKQGKENGQRRRAKQEDALGSVLHWEHEESKKQIHEIATKLSAICGVELDRRNLVLQLDRIGEKVSGLMLLEEENKMLRAKNKLLADQRHSEQWSKIE